MLHHFMHPGTSPTKTISNGIENIGVNLLKYPDLQLTYPAGAAIINT